MRSTVVPAALTAAARRAKRVACLHPFAVYPAPAGPDLAAFREIGQRVAGLAIEDQTQLLPRMRAVKSKAELALMRKAADATAAGYDELFGLIKPGLTETDLDRTLDAPDTIGTSPEAAQGEVGGGRAGSVEALRWG